MHKTRPHAPCNGAVPAVLNGSSRMETDSMSASLSDLLDWTSHRVHSDSIEAIKSETHYCTAQGRKAPQSQRVRRRRSGECILWRTVPPAVVKQITYIGCSCGAEVGTPSAGKIEPCKGLQFYKDEGNDPQKGAGVWRARTERLPWGP